MPHVIYIWGGVFVGMTTYIDDAIANITAALQQTGMWNNTVFIFSTGKISPKSIFPLNYI